MRNVAIAALVVLQYLLMLFAILAGFGEQGAWMVAFGVLALAGIVVYSIGLRAMGARRTPTQQKRGYQLMVIACLPTMPLSLMFGYLPARMLAKDRGLLAPVTLGGAAADAPAPRTISTPVPTERAADVRHFYTRKLFGPYVFWLGVVLAAILVIALANGAWGAVRNLGFGAAIFLLFGGANRKPRMTLTAEYVDVRPNELGAPQRIRYADIASVSAAPNMRIALKNGTEVKFAKFEFPKRTREAFVHTLQNHILRVSADAASNRQANTNVMF